MKKWFLLTIALYLILLVLLCVPTLTVAFAPHISLVDALDIYAMPLAWIWITVFTAAQALLLLIPVGAAEHRPKPRRKLLIPILTSALFMALLFLGSAVCILLALWGDHTNERLGRPYVGNATPWSSWAAIPLLLILTWAGWAFLFYRFRSAAPPHLLTRRLTRWLLAGSILELLIAVPCHIIVRQRDDCCAPTGTFLGICCGISVMLLSFGPGVFFLFARRIDLLRGWPEGHCRSCNYDLRAHLQGAAGQRCPECGTPIPTTQPENSPRPPSPQIQ